MYSKFEEMSVMKQTIQNYASNQKSQYESILSELKGELNNFPNIDSDIATFKIDSLQTKTSLLSNYRTDYQNALSVVNELDKAIRSYYQAYSIEDISLGGIADRHMKEGNRIFHEIRTKNAEYKRIIDEIAFRLFCEHDPHIDGLELNFDAKADSLEKDFQTGKITKEQLIYYTNMVSALLQNPDYIKYMSQFHQQETQGPRK